MSQAMPILYLGILDAILIYVDITIAYGFEIGITMDDVAHTHLDCPEIDR